jgi:hypothetical protein
VNTFLHCDPSRPWDCAKFAVGHGELLRFLSTTGAAVTKVASNCVPTVPTDWKLIAAAAVAGVLGLAGLVVGLRRQSRDAVVQYVSRSFGRRDRGEKVARDHGQKVVQPPPPPPPSVATYLVGLAGPLAGAEIPLGPEPIFVGRDPKVANVVLPEDTHGVSRRHLEVVFKDGHVQVRDSWSTQGTRVGGRKVEPGGWITVAPGDRIELGGPGVQFGIRS